MRYLGGKVRQAARIEGEVLRLRGTRRTLLEPFMGGCAVTARLAPRFDRVTASDVVPDLVMLWQAVQTGWEPPAEMTRGQYDALRDAEPSALRGWAMFAVSYNGKAWAGYGPTASGRDYLDESKRSTLRKARALEGVRFVCCDYREHEPDADTVVYCDPPYAETTGYGAAGWFDHAAFWATMGAWVDRGALVLVSEYQAPEGWVSVLDVERSATMDPRKSRTRTEGLYVRRDQLGRRTPPPGIPLRGTGSLQVTL